MAESLWVEKTFFIFYASSVVLGVGVILDAEDVFGCGLI